MVVAEATWVGIEALGARLVEAAFVQPLPHRFRSPEGAIIDLIPFGPGVVRDGRITWPTGESMIALGLEEALSTAVRRTPAAGLEVEIASEPAYAILKIVAYEERRHEWPHDVSALSQTPRRGLCRLLRSRRPAQSREITLDVTHNVRHDQR